VQLHNLTPTKLAMSVDEFCRAHSIGRTTFYAEVQAKRLSTVKIGARTLITATEAMRWLRSYSGESPTG